MVRRVLLGLLAGATLATDAQAVTYAHYDITFEGTINTIDTSAGFNLIGRGSFTLRYLLNLASDMNGTAYDPALPSYSVGFNANGLGVRDNDDAFFYDTFGVQSSLPAVNGLPNIQLGSITSSSITYGPRRSYPYAIFYDLHLTAASTTFSDAPSGRVLQLSPAPEAATWAMMVVGFGAIGSAMRSRRQTRVKFA